MLIPNMFLYMGSVMILDAPMDPHGARVSCCSAMGPMSAFHRPGTFHHYPGHPVTTIDLESLVPYIVVTGILGCTVLGSLLVSAGTGVHLVNFETHGSLVNCERPTRRTGNRCGSSESRSNGEASTELGGEIKEEKEKDTCHMPAL